MSAPQSAIHRRSRYLKFLWLVPILMILGVCAIVISTMSSPAIGNVFPEILADIESRSSASSSSQGLASAQMPHVIIRTGSINLTVDDTLKTKADIKALIAGMSGEGAFVVQDDERIEGGAQMPVVELSVRVPAARFDEVMDRLAGMAVRVTSRSETAEDVTEEYVDLEARIRAMEAARDRLQQIMEQSGTVADLLLAESELARREAELESLKGRLQFLSDSARLSLIEITLEPSAAGQPAGGFWRPGDTVRWAFSGLVWTFQAAAQLLIYFAVIILPWIVLIGLIVLGVRYVRRRFFAPRPADAPKPAPKRPKG